MCIWRMVKVRECMRRILPRRPIYIYLLAVLCLTAGSIGETSKMFMNSPKFLNFLEYIGYLAYPLLLYIFVETVKQKELKLLVSRLYIVGIACGIFRTFVNFILLETISISMGIENLIFVFFFIVACLLVVQLVLDGVQRKNTKFFIYATIITFFMFVIPFIFHGLLYDSFFEWISTYFNRDYSICNMFHDICVTIFPTPIHCGVSCLWIVMGVALYYANTKIKKCITIILFGFLSVVCSYFSISLFGFAEAEKAGYLMAGVLPVIILYDRGEAIMRRSFYVYYPVHSCFCFSLFYFLFSSKL